MKKLFFIFAFVLGILTASARDNYSHDVNILPEAAQTVIKQNFRSDVSHIKVGKEFGRIREYDVVMTDGSEVYFDKHGHWKEIETRRTSAVPSALIPRPIANFVKANQNSANITGIEKKNYGYEVELSNGKDLRFTEKGKFIRYDD